MAYQMVATGVILNDLERYPQMRANNELSSSLETFIFQWFVVFRHSGVSKGEESGQIAWDVCPADFREGEWTYN